MIVIREVIVESYSPDFLDVRWEPENTQEDPADYTFEVQRSESPAGPFERVKDHVATANLFSLRDHSVELKTKWRIYYYRILVTETASGDQHLSKVGYFGLKPDLVALELARSYQLLLKVHIGTPVLIFKRRTSGPACLECWDEDLERKTRSMCAFCLGEGFRGGYLSPIPTFVNQTPKVKSRQVTPAWEAEDSELTFDMAGYPILAPGDLIVDPVNHRYRVENVQNRSKQGFVHRQILRVVELPKTDVVYKLFVNPELFPNREGPLWPDRADFGELQIAQDYEEVRGR